MKNLLKSSLLLILLIGCYQPEEGCLEFWATNYDVLADRPCEDIESCCSQPSLSLSFKYYVNDSTQYNFGDTIEHASGATYSLLSSNLFTHSFSLLFDTDTIALDIDSTLIKSSYYTNNFGFSNRQGTNIPLTQYRQSFPFNQIDFVLGIPALLQDTTIFGADSRTVAAAIDTLINIENDTFFSTFSCNIGLHPTDDSIQCKSSLFDSLDFSLLFETSEVNFGSSTNVTAIIAIADLIDQVDIFGLENDVIADQLANELATNSANYISLSIE